MLTAEEIICKYYPADDALRRLLVGHSRMVADKALRIAAVHPELHVNAAFVERAAMLHDIGIFLTDAPGIHCHGTHPYLLHGHLGAQLMRREGDEAVARVCERHTGTGLTAETIERQNIPLPTGIYVPVTVEEQIICYADKYFSKSHPDVERTYEQTCRSVARWGDDCLATFMAWHRRFC